MRCFLAIGLPPDLCRQLEAVVRDAKGLGLAASFSKPEQLHLTLLFLGEKDEEQVQRIQTAISQLKFPPFKLAVQAAGFFPDDHRINVFWAGAESKGGELLGLHQEVCKLLGLAPETRFSGHVTLARIKAPRNLDGLRRLKQSLETRVFGEFTVEKVVLKKSTLTPEGAVYEDLNTFPLQ